MKPLKLLALILLVVLVLFWSVKTAVFKRFSSAAKSAHTAEDSKDALTEKVRSFSLSGFSETGEKTWELEGKSADILAQVINLFDINADSYGEDVKVNLKADEGVFNRTTNNIRLKKNVVITTDEGTILTTELLDWDAKEELVSTEEYVFIQRKDMDIEGTGASAKPDLKVAQLDKEVKVDVKDPPAIITCDGPLEVDYNHNIAYFYNNVRLVDKETIIDTDKATAYFEPKEKKLVKVVCDGNVKITRGKDITYADKMTYLPEEGRVILQGRPKIFIESGDELIKEHKEKQNE